MGIDTEKEACEKLNNDWFFAENRLKEAENKGFISIPFPDVNSSLEIRVTYEPKNKNIKALEYWPEGLMPKTWFFKLVSNGNGPQETTLYVPFRESCVNPTYVFDEIRSTIKCYLSGLIDFPDLQGFMEEVYSRIKKDLALIEGDKTNFISTDEKKGSCGTNRENIDVFITDDHEKGFAIFIPKKESYLGTDGKLKKYLKRVKLYPDTKDKEEGNGICQVIKDLRSRGIDARLLDIRINKGKCHIEHDCTEEYIKSKLL